LYGYLWEHFKIPSDDWRFFPVILTGSLLGFWFLIVDDWEFYEGLVNSIRRMIYRHEWKRMLAKKTTPERKKSFLVEGNVYKGRE